MPSKQSFLIVLILLSWGTIAAQENNVYVQPRWSHDGQKLLLTKENHQGVYCFDKNQGTLWQITAARGAGYRMNWSYDNSRVAFKLIQEDQSQTPVVFDVTAQKLIQLAPASPRCGVPFFMPDGKVCFSVDQDIYILESNYTLVRKISVGYFANLCVPAPNGRWIAYNDRRDQICLVATDNDRKIQLTQDEHAYFAPLWSPDSQKLLVSTVSGTLKVIVPETMEVYTIDSGENPVWLPDSRNVLYMKIARSQGEVATMDLYQSDYTGNIRHTVTSSPERWEAYADYNFADHTLAVYDERDQQLYTTPIGTATSDLRGDTFSRLSLPAPTTPSIETLRLSSITLPQLPQDTLRGTKVLSNVPYVHQVYDTPNWYNGRSACGASSAMMAISYYRILPNWDCTVSVPYSHVSHFGRYVCEQYSCGGYTFNKMTTDPSGHAAYGGYGFICQNNWEDTKTHMAEYFQKHGISSSVDWSPTWEELCNEINNSHPFVILTSITSSGHYILGIGYYTAQHTVIVNDPYGDKDTPGYPSYDGAGATYDWPGYNNGHANLRTVHCFIYARR